MISSTISSMFSSLTIATMERIPGSAAVLAQVSYGSGGLTFAGRTVSTKTLLGWALAVGVGYLAYNTITAFVEARKERENSKKMEEAKFAFFFFLAGLGVLGILSALGFISFSEISSSLNAL